VQGTKISLGPIAICGIRHFPLRVAFNNPSSLESNASMGHVQSLIDAECNEKEQVIGLSSRVPKRQLIVSPIDERIRHFSRASR